MLIVIITADSLVPDQFMQLECTRNHYSSNLFEASICKYIEESFSFVLEYLYLKEPLVESKLERYEEMALSQPNSFIGSKHLLELYSNISICINFFEYTKNKLCSLTVVFNTGRKQNFGILSNAEKTSLSSSFSRREREWHNCKTWFWKCYKWLC